MEKITVPCETKKSAGVYHAICKEYASKDQVENRSEPASEEGTSGVTWQGDKVPREWSGASPRISR